MDELNLNKPTEGDSQSNKKARPIERITLGTDEAARVQSWMSRLKDSSSGFLDITKSDVVNFLIRQHAADLSAKEMKGIRSAHYDPIRHLNWITPRLKAALEQNDREQVAALQSEIRGIELSIVAAATSSNCTSPEALKPRKRRRKSPDAESNPTTGET